MTQERGPGSRPEFPEVAPAAEPVERTPPLRRNTIVSMAGRSASIVLWIAITPFVLGTLGQERFGVWALLFALTGYIGTLDLGMSGGVSRFVAVAVARKDRAGVRWVILRSLWLSAALGVVWCGVFALGRGAFVSLFHVPEVWAQETRVSLVIFGLSLLPFSIGQVFQWALIGFQRFDLWNINLLAGVVLNGGVLVAGLAMGYGLVATAIASMVSQVATLLLAVGSVRSCLRRLDQSPDPGPAITWRNLLGFGAMVQASNALAIAQMQAAKVMLGILGPLVWVTQFELGFRVVTTPWSSTVLIQNASYPAAAHANEVGGAPLVRDVYAWCSRWVLALSGAVLGAIWLLAPPLYFLWLGEPNPEAATVARWLCVAFALCTLAGPATSMARGIGAPVLEVLNFGIALVVNVLLGLWLIPLHGYVGAAIAMIASFLIASAVLAAVLHRRLAVSTPGWLLQMVGPRLGAAAILAAGLSILTSRWTIESRGEAFWAVAVQGGAFAVLYAAVLWRSGETQTLVGLLRVWAARLVR